MMEEGSPTSKLLGSSAEYHSDLGSAYRGDSRELLRELPDESIDLIVTSPPFALQHQKEYGNENLEEYNDWFMEFAHEARRVLQPHGSFVIEIGGAFERGIPRRSTYQFELICRLTDEEEGRLHLAQDFYWFNPAKLPNPIEWVNVRKIRVTDAVTHVWWLAKDINKVAATDEDGQPHPEADNRRVLQPYKDSQKKLIETGEYNDGKRPSGWDIDSEAFANDNGGAIPKNMGEVDKEETNLIEASNTASNTHYLKMCRKFDMADSHPARFPRDIPEFFIDFLTPNPPYDDWDRGALDRPVVLDIFAGSNLTGRIAEDKGRYWLAFEENSDYVSTSQFRFLSEEEIRSLGYTPEEQSQEAQ